MGRTEQGGLPAVGREAGEEWRRRRPLHTHSSPARAGLTPASAQSRGHVQSEQVFFTLDQDPQQPEPPVFPTQSSGLAQKGSMIKECVDGRRKGTKKRSG